MTRAPPSTSPAGSSSTRLATTEKPGPVFRVTPNPVADQLTLRQEIPSAAGQTYTLTITDMEGKTRQIMLLVHPGANQPIDVSTLPTGQYLLNLSDGTRREVHKVIKQ